MADELPKKMLSSISSILVGSSFDEESIELVLKRLEAISYAIKEEDAWMISFAAQKVENTIKNSCNTASIPDGLRLVAIDMVCGEFLYSKKQTGGLEGFDFAPPTKSISEGDTTLSFAVGGSDGALTPEAQFDALLGRLLNPPQDQLVAYRRIKW